MDYRQHRIQPGLDQGRSGAVGGRGRQDLRRRPRHCATALGCITTVPGLLPLAQTVMNTHTARRACVVGGYALNALLQTAYLISGVFVGTADMRYFSYWTFVLEIVYGAVLVVALAGALHSHQRLQLLPLAMLPLVFCTSIMVAVTASALVIDAPSLLLNTPVPLGVAVLGHLYIHFVPVVAWVGAAVLQSEQLVRFYCARSSLCGANDYKVRYWLPPVLYLLVPYAWPLVYFASQFVSVTELYLWHHNVALLLLIVIGSVALAQLLLAAGLALTTSVASTAALGASQADALSQWEPAVPPNARVCTAVSVGAAAAVVDDPPSQLAAWLQRIAAEQPKTQEAAAAAAAAAAGTTTPTRHAAQAPPASAVVGWTVAEEQT